MRPLPVHPRQTVSAIGGRLRNARKNRQMTIEQLAATTKLSKGFLSRVERDQTSPSVATLITICDVLNLDIGSLFQESDVRLVTRDEAPKIDLGGQNVHEVLLTPRTENRLQVLRSVIDPGLEASGGDELYTLSSEVEALHVLRGNIRVRFAEASYDLHAGDTLTMDARDPHSWHTLDDEGAELLWILAPAAWGTI